MNGCRPLLFASVQGQVAVVRLLLRRGSSASLKLPALISCKDNFTRFCWQGYGQHLRLEACADKSLASNEGTTPLMAASAQGHVEIAELLSDDGVALDQTDNNSTTALMCASFRGNADVVHLLLQAPRPCWGPGLFSDS